MSTTAFLETLGRLSFGAAGLALLVAGAQFLLRHHLSAGARSALWLLVVARLLLPVSLESNLSVDRLIGGEREASFVTAPGSAPDAPVSVAASSSATRTTMRDAALPAVEESSPVRARWELSTVLFALWLSGCSLFGLVLLVSTAREGRRLARCLPCTDASLLARWRKCAARMKVARLPEIRMSPTSIGPGLFGFLRPKLLLPADFTANFSLREQEAILLHELAHVQRRDLSLNWLIAGLQIIHWFNPILWLAFARWRTDREIACDARAVELMGAGASREFGQALLRMLEHDRPILSGSIRAGFRERHRELRRRLAAIARFSPGQRRPAPAIVAAGVLAAVGLTDAQVVDSPNPAQPEFSHLAFVIDTSGSMRSIDTNLLWPVVGEIMEEAFDDHPEVIAFSVLDSDGNPIVASDSAIWIPNGMGPQSEAIEVVRNYLGDSRSNPRSGLVRITNSWRDATGARINTIPGLTRILTGWPSMPGNRTRLYVMVIGDEFTEEVAPVLRELAQLNAPDESGRRPASINAVQLPTIIGFSPIGGPNDTNVKFQELMSAVAAQNDGTYQLLSSLNRDDTSSVPSEERSFYRAISDEYVQSEVRSRQVQAVAQLALQQKLDEAAEAGAPTLPIYLDEVERLIADAEFQTAIQVLNEAVRSAGDIENNPRVALARAELERQNSPVEIELWSEGLTYISVSGLNPPVRTETLSLSMLPGDYKVLGQRPGYKPAQILLKVRAGMTVLPISVICTVPEDD